MKKFNFLNKMFWLLVALSASAVFFNSCEKDDDNDKSGVKSAELEEFGYDGDMPDELLEFFASLPKYRGADYSISTEPILRSTQAEQSDKLSRIFMDMISDAVFLSTYAPPGQKKLVYKWGSKDPGLLSVASPKYNKDGTIRPDTPSCKDSVYGLDCSGLIYQLFKLNNVLLNNNVLNKQYVAEQINGIMKMKTVQDINVKARKLEIGKVSVANLKTGDIIYYVSNGEAYHIGMFYKENDNQVVLFQSLGSWDKTCEENAAESMNRGVGGVTMDNTTLGKHLMKYKNRCNIIRIETDNMLDGTWVGPDKYCAVTIDGSSGAFAQINSGGFLWLLNNGRIGIGTPKFIDIIKTGDLKWTCQELWYEYYEDTGTPSGKIWYENATITMNKNGKIINVTSSDGDNSTFSKSDKIIPVGVFANGNIETSGGLRSINEGEPILGGIGKGKSKN